MSETPPIAEIGQWIILTGEGWKKDNPQTAGLDGPGHGTIHQVIGYQDANYDPPGRNEPSFMWDGDEYAAARTTDYGDWRYEIATDEQAREALGEYIQERIAVLRAELADLERIWDAR